MKASYRRKAFIRTMIYTIILIIVIILILAGNIDFLRQLRGF